jgi:hypothetical protein
MTAASSSSTAYRPPLSLPASAPKGTPFSSRSQQSSHQYPLRSRISSVAPAPESAPSPPKKRKRENNVDPDTFYWLLAAKIGREHQKGSVGRKWSNKILTAAEELCNDPSKEFIKAYNTKNGKELASLLRKKVQLENPFSLEVKEPS